MVQKRLVGNPIKNFLQVFQVGGAHQLLPGIRIFKNKIAKSKILRDKIAKLVTEIFSVFINKSNLNLTCNFLHALIGRLQEYRHKFIGIFYHFTKMQARLLIEHAIALIAHVGNDAKQVVLVFMVNLFGFFIRGGQQNLGASAHPQHFLMVVERLGHE